MPVPSRGLLCFLLLLGISIPCLWAGPLDLAATVEKVDEDAHLRSSDATGSEGRVAHRIRPGDTLAKILRPYALPAEERELWFRSIRRHYSTRKLRPGKEIYLYFRNGLSSPRGHRAERQLRALEMVLARDRVLAWERNGKGITFAERARPGASDFPAATADFHSNGATNGAPVGFGAGLESVTHSIRSGDTLIGILRPYGLARKEKRLWLASIRRHFSPKRLRAGKEIYLYFSAPAPAQPEEESERRLRALEIELNHEMVLTWERGPHGISFRKRERPYETEIKAAGGRITDSLYRSGLPPALVSPFIDIFAWDVNFQRDLREGDTFRVLYERRYRKGSKSSEVYRILAAELINRGQKHLAFYFRNGNGEGNYYDLDGSSLARSFLRYPLDFNRISSTFSHRRLHPILKVRRPHYGVDFVAKRGTPVRAIGDGRVTYAGWKNGGYGRFIEIRHGSSFRTRYAHLRGLARGIRPGARVKKGQIIGTVGCSGSCTGPHLHFELYKGESYVNPLEIKLPREDKIAPSLRTVFENAKQQFITELVASPQS